MTRKTSAYTRKAIAQGRTYASRGEARRHLIGAGLRPLLDSRDYRDPIHQKEVTQIMVDVRLALQRLTDRLVGPDELEPYELLSHIVEVAQIRVCEIAYKEGDGAIQQAGALIETLNAGARALERARLRWLGQRVWGLDGPALHELREAVDVFQDVLTASSPVQMRAAQKERVRRARLREAQGPSAQTRDGREAKA